MSSWPRNHHCHPSSPSSVSPLYTYDSRKTDPGESNRRKEAGHPTATLHSMSFDPTLENLPPQPPQPLQAAGLDEAPTARVHFGPQAGAETSAVLQTATAANPISDKRRSLTPAPSDSLILLPEVAKTGRPAGSKRPFQRRRRSRACDACRARKTKVRECVEYGP